MGVGSDRVIDPSPAIVDDRLESERLHGTAIDRSLDLIQERLVHRVPPEDRVAPFVELDHPGRVVAAQPVSLAPDPVDA